MTLAFTLWTYQSRGKALKLNNRVEFIPEKDVPASNTASARYSATRQMASGRVYDLGNSSSREHGARGP